MSMTEALERRRVFVRMRDGRAEEEFADLLKFRDEHGIAPFLMASCRLWEVRGDKPWNDVVIGSADDLTEAQQWIVDCIVANGYAVSRDQPAPRDRHGAPQHRHEARSEIEAQAHQRRGRARAGGQERTRVQRVPRRHRQGHDRSHAGRRRSQDGATVAGSHRGRHRGHAGRLRLSGHVRHGQRGETLLRLGQKPHAAGRQATADGRGRVCGRSRCRAMAVIDLDVAKDPATGEVLKDAPTGWDVFNREIGEYGSEDFPKTYLVGTPTGRRNGLPSAHAYYLDPARTARPAEERRPREGHAGRHPLRRQGLRGRSGQSYIRRRLPAA